MPESNDSTHPISRRNFIKLLGLTLGTSLAAPILASCVPTNEHNDQVDIVTQQNSIQYSPATLVVKEGTTVTWQNKTYYSQSITCDPSKAGPDDSVGLPKGAQPWDSGMLYPGQTFTKTFDVPGTYIYFSLPKLSANTVGTIIVE